MSWSCAATAHKAKHNLTIPSPPPSPPNPTVADVSRLSARSGCDVNSRPWSSQSPVAGVRRRPVARRQAMTVERGTTMIVIRNEEELLSVYVSVLCQFAHTDPIWKQREQASEQA